MWGETYVCVPNDAVERLRVERDDALERARKQEFRASIATNKVHELEAEVAQLRPAIAALNAEREHYEALNSKA